MQRNKPTIPCPFIDCGKQFSNIIDLEEHCMIIHNYHKDDLEIDLMS